MARTAPRGTKDEQDIFVLTGGNCLCVPEEVVGPAHPPEERQWLQQTETWAKLRVPARVREQ